MIDLTEAARIESLADERSGTMIDLTEAARIENLADERSGTMIDLTEAARIKSLADERSGTATSETNDMVVLTDAAAQTDTVGPRQRGEWLLTVSVNVKRMSPISQRVAFSSTSQAP
jgi:hypothetical protein